VPISFRFRSFGLRASVAPRFKLETYPRNPGNPRFNSLADFYLGFHLVPTRPPFC